MSRAIDADALERDGWALHRTYQKDATTMVHETKNIKDIPTIEPEPHWIPCSERLPEDLEEVNITFTNLEPEPYYDFIKGKRFTGSAVFYKGDWYWYSSITVDVLKEYGRYESEKIDEGIKIIAWMPLPEPYKEEGEE